MNKITIEDKFSIKDAIKNNADKFALQRRKSPFVGMVRIYEDGILNTDQTNDGWLFNMTIGSGREFANQSIFRSASNGSNFSSSPLGDLSNYKVDSFSVGSNGSTIDSNDNITLLGPNVCDIASPRPIALNTNCFKSRDSSVGNVTIPQYPYVVKKIESTFFGSNGEIGSISPEYSTDIEFSDCQNTYFTITKCVCRIEAGEPVDLSPGDIIKIDEAFLYATHPNMDHTNDSTTHKVVPFAHICFAPKFVEKESVFIIEWFIIF